MAFDRSDTDERLARVRLMMQQFRDAKRKAIVRRGITLWMRTEATRRASALTRSTSR